MVCVLQIMHPVAVYIFQYSSFALSLRSAKGLLLLLHETRQALIGVLATKAD